MASFRIHEDQENRRPEIRQKESIKNPLQQKRTVLGALDNKPIKFTTNAKQVVSQDIKSKDENIFTKQQPSRKPIPPVPVAQFEAFKVYEDKPEETKCEVPKNTVTDPVFNNKENVVATDLKERVRDDSAADTPMSQGSVVGSPINVAEVLPNVSTKPLKMKQEKDVFFEIPEYRADIHKYLRDAERRSRPKSFYMRKQPDITYSMRTILVDWLVEVAEEYRLQTETLYLAVSFIDRFLSYMSVVRAKLQLVGTAAMFIASKYEEIYPPDVGEFVYITDDTYNKQQVLRMEQLILKVLSFDVSVPTPLTFLTKFCVLGEQTDKVKFLAMYICELSLLEADPYLALLPSTLAAAGLMIARDTLEMEPWPAELVRATHYEVPQLLTCARHLFATYTRAATLQQQAIQEKYKSSKYQHVSMLLPRNQLTLPPDCM